VVDCEISLEGCGYCLSLSISAGTFCLSLFIKIYCTALVLNLVDFLDVI